MSLVHDLATAALRRLDAETAHRAAVAALAAGLGPRARVADPILATTVGGVALPSCIGLAAGFDKDAQAPDAILKAGFGFVECGTVTPLPQAGNPRPRLFRLTDDQAVINRMGFNSGGLEAFARRLERRRAQGLDGVVGANLGANKDSSDRAGDYCAGLSRLWGLADYFTINISSPNTPGLRALQTKAALDELLQRFAATRAALSGHAPVFLKVAPDMDDGEPEAIVESAMAHGLDALIVGNTTVSRPPGLRSPHAGETGGLSGAPLATLASRTLTRFAAASDGRIALIAAGGIGSGAQAYERIRAGAGAVQLYSALVYDGLGLVQRIEDDLAQLLRRDGFSHVGQAVGQAR
jgi:dihydroorotate dehydrogenase